MKDQVYIIVGASRGLGALLVRKYLETGVKVIGVGRTSEDVIKDIAGWKQTGRFNYVQMDITEGASIDAMKSIISMCEGNPVCIIFNAAIIESDVGDNKHLRFEVFKKVNRTGIDGFGHVLEAFSDYLILHGGMLVGISSISAQIPPIGGNKVAYPAAKAYLDMALRSLRLLWDKQVHVMIVHLGHIGGDRPIFVPSYDAIAKKIVNVTVRNYSPEQLCMSTFYCFAYSILRMMPDRFLTNISKIMGGLFKQRLYK